MVDGPLAPGQPRRAVRGGPPRPQGGAVPRRLPRRLEKKEPDIFAAVRAGDILLHHPFDSFAPVLDFLEAAAVDPDVLAIKMTLYRVGRNSPWSRRSWTPARKASRSRSWSS